MEKLTCRVCGKLLDRPETGRPPRYCGPSCRRQVEYRRRKGQRRLRWAGAWERSAKRERSERHRQRWEQGAARLRAEAARLLGESEAPPSG